MQKAIIAFKDIANRITGISIPIFGVSWNPSESEREIIRETFIFLEDRRALYNDFAHELETEVVESVQIIRNEITGALKRVPENSKAIAPLKAVRAACREYLDNSRGNNFAGSIGPYSFLTRLGRFRAMVGVQVAYLAAEYGIDIEGELARVVPPEFKDAKYLED